MPQASLCFNVLVNMQRLSFEMKSPLIFIGIVLAIIGCTNSENNKSELVGVWKSNAEKTLASMRSTDGITKKAKNLFENDFFGHLVAEYRKNDGRVYFDKDEENTVDMKEFSPYELLEENKDKFVFKYYDQLEQTEKVVTLLREGDCYYMLVSKWNFREYMCKVEK